jgi:phosphoribosylanthranilate isomerase
MTKIKICGLSRPCDIEFVNEARPDWCGFILNFPKSRRNVTPDQARALRAGLDGAITPVGVFVDQPVEEVAALLRDGTISIAQLHGHEDEDYLAALRALAPGKELWKAFKVRTAEDLAAANASTADLVVLDNGQGSGQTFDWSCLTGAARPFLLAGGLDPDNIPRAIATVRPYGLDLSSGVETDGVKDRDKILAAVAAAKTGRQKERTP